MKGEPQAIMGDWRKHRLCANPDMAAQATNPLVLALHCLLASPPSRDAMRAKVTCDERFELLRRLDRST